MQKLLFTGGTGFLGANAKPILDKSYEVTTIGITDRDMLKANLVTGVPNLPGHYDVVLHAAGKAHVYPKTEAEVKSFYEVNYQGTVNLCKALENVGVPKSFVFISTEDVYDLDKGENIDEDTPLNPVSHYAKSKLQAEQYLIDWAKSNGVILGILRPSLLAGPNPPGNLGDMIRGIRKGYYLTIAGGTARKSLLMAEDIGRIIPLIAEKGGIYNVNDNEHPAYGDLAKSIAKQMGKRAPISIPYWMAKCMALIGDVLPFLPINSYRLAKLVDTTTYSNEKAKRNLGWEPLNVLDNFRIS